MSEVFIDHTLFPQILAFKIKEHTSPAEVRTGCLEFKLGLVVSWGEWETPPPPQAQKAQLLIFSQPPYGVHLSWSGGLLDFRFPYVFIGGCLWFFSRTNNAGFTQVFSIRVLFSLARVSLTAPLPRRWGSLCGAFMSPIFRNHTQHVRRVGVQSVLLTCLVTFVRIGLWRSGNLFEEAPL